MSEPSQSPESRPTPPGIYDPAPRDGITGIEVAAAALSAVWLLGAVVFFAAIESDGAGLDRLRFLMTMLAVFLPVGMIWVAATAARASRVMREESRRLQAAIDAIRHAYLTQSQSGGTGANSVSRKLDEIAMAQRKTETALAMFTSSRESDRATGSKGQRDVRSPAGQTSLELGTPADALTPPLANADFVRALNFPETAEDEAGFAALRRALKDRQSAQLIQAAQDVLTLLSQDGIYMDDLRPDMARPEIWRSFASGERGRAIAALGGVRDRSSLALTAGRMKQDPIFRDAAHHFLRVFDRTFAGFAERAGDADIAALAETRTARAFMLLGRVAGTFD